jgi:hypothetical protein
MVEVEKSPFENLIAGPSGWPDAYHQLRQVIGARARFCCFSLLPLCSSYGIGKRSMNVLASERSSSTSNAKQSPPHGPDISQ